MKLLKTILPIVLCLLSACVKEIPTQLNIGPDNDAPIVVSTTNPLIDENSVSLGTFNLWADNIGTDEYAWSNRAPVLAQSIVLQDWDIFGAQEASGKIRSELPELIKRYGGRAYKWYTETDGLGLGNCIIYDPERLELKQTVRFWLSETPETRSKGWDEGYYRFAVAAVVHDKRTGKDFFFMTTHGPLKDYSNESSPGYANEAASELIIKMEKKYNPDGLPSIFCGDLNTLEYSQSSINYRTWWADAWQTCDGRYRYGPLTTLNGHNPNRSMNRIDKHIDYIYYRNNAALLSYRCDATMFNNIYPSDHFPITCVFNMGDPVEQEEAEPVLSLQGTGTEGNPWKISTAEEWNSVAKDMQSPSPQSYFNNQYYELTADIDFAGTKPEGMGLFSGVLDGAGHCLKGINLSAPSASYGLISANSGTVRDLSVEGSFSTAYNTLGGIVGVNEGLVDGCTFKGDISGLAEAAVIGGIAGKNTGVIINCGNLGGRIVATTATKSENMGGICGWASGTGAVLNCYSFITSIASSNNNIGGVVGLAGTDGIVINCYSTISSITSGDSYGSVVGYSKVGNLVNLYGNTVCPSKTEGAAVGHDKKAGTWYPQTAQTVLAPDAMKGGVSVAVPSSGEVCSDFLAALNKSAALIQEQLSAARKDKVTVREWAYGADGYPVLLATPLGGAPAVKRRVAVIGDSISTFDGYIVSGYRAYYPTSSVADVSSVDKTYWHKFIYGKMTDAELCRNLSWSGSLVTRIADDTYKSTHWYTKYFYARAAADGFGNADVLIVNGGTNDYTYQGGTITTESDNSLAPGYKITGTAVPSDSEFAAWFASADAATSLTTVAALPDDSFVQAYIKLLQLAKISCKPGLKMILCIGDALNETCEKSIQKIAVHYGAAVVDFYDINGNYKNPLNSSYNPIPKGSSCHPNAAGMTFMANYMWEKTSSFLSQP